MACRYLNRFLHNRQSVLYHKTVESLYHNQTFSNSLLLRHTSPAQIKDVGSRFPPIQIKAPSKTKNLHNISLNNSKSAVCFSTSTKNYIDNDNLKEKAVPSQQKLSFEPKKKPDSFIAPYLQLARVDKPIGTMLLLWPCGLAFNWGALLGWSAMTGSLDWKVTLPLYLAGVNWTLIYDTIYAHQDKKDDIKIGVKSTALFMASDTRKYLTGFSLATIGLLCTSGFFNGQGLPFYLATLLGGGTHLAWQLNTVEYNCSKSCWDKFKSNQQFGALVAFGIYADYMIAYL
ncbi:Para-hydroxybenzoate--polyprenyltransferase, mitochondrial precursor (PHB:polyprenyltransferase) [Entomophthora muscae]|uniref:Para-hydroxybenzoate--polyprenyltransferase, mitochondrial (PHB:polyprenyltransferase) n=1 Tax=Entomophthora muscae TaxID=34485 RepID=A0ACC2S7N4_9FUNG|nr:Para-hydroxybenzoate--polyprenyltransferase, mitochondrial precursor (PHB:polyprenyltransferase) [Entomophthora muscae]